MRQSAASAIARLVEHHYLDDEEFARYWLENRNRFRPRSAKAIRYELRQKGVDREAIEAALEGMDEDDAAWDAATSKLDRWRNLPEDEFEHKLSGFLARRGFGFATVRRTVQRAWRKLSKSPSRPNRSGAGCPRSTRPNVLPANGKRVP